MMLNRILMLISILKSIRLEMTTVWPWFVRKVQRSIPTKQIFHTVIQSKFDKTVRNFDKNVIWNNLHTFPFKTENWYFPPQQLFTFSQKEVSDFVFVFSNLITFVWYFFVERGSLQLPFCIKIAQRHRKFDFSANLKIMKNTLAPVERYSMIPFMQFSKFAYTLRWALVCGFHVPSPFPFYFQNYG